VFRCAPAKRQPVRDRAGPVVTGWDDMGVTVDETPIHVPK
jgi:hypothetical protein